MPTFERLLFAVDTAEQIMNEWSDDESNTVDILILPANNVDSLTDEEVVQDDDLMIDIELPSDVCGMVQVQTSFLNGEENDDEVEDHGNAK